MTTPSCATPRPLPLLAAALLLLATALAGADGNREPLALRGIMQSLDHDLGATGLALQRRAWADAEHAARRIAEHPQPGLGEKMKILAFIGMRAPRFRTFDSEMRAAAVTLGNAAAQGDQVAATAAHRKLQDACHACHAAFHDEFVEHFYPGELPSRVP